MLIPTDKPVYRVLATQGFFGPNDHLYPEGATIIFMDEPNEEMEPLNDLAHKAQRSYFEKLDAAAAAGAKAAGRPFIARAASIEDAIALSREDARRVQLVQGDGGVPLTGARRNGPERVKELTDEGPAETGTHRGKLHLAQKA